MSKIEIAPIPGIQSMRDCACPEGNEVELEVEPVAVEAGSTDCACNGPDESELTLEAENHPSFGASIAYLLTKPAREI